MSEETVMEEQPKAPEKGSGLGKTLLIVIVAVILSSGSAGAISWFMINKTISAQAKNEPLDPAAEAQKMAELLQTGGVIALEPFVVNLADPQPPRYLKIKISLMVDEKTKLKEVAENEALVMKVRDVILQTLTAKSSQDLITQNGKNRLRQEIQDKISVYFLAPKLVDVMFTEFVIQL